MRTKDKTIGSTAFKPLYKLIEWFEGGAADGFIFGPHIYGPIYDDFINEILPRLEQQGYYHQGYKGKTLRENIGVPYKENRYSKQTIGH